MAELCCVGLSHRSAPIEVREKLAVPEEAQAALLHELLQLPGVGEAMLLSTCNRAELFAAVATPEAADALAARLVAQGGELVRPHLLTHRGEAAVVHLFRVAASLDSMVVGEPQILGQVKDAFAASVSAGTAGGELTRVCEAAFNAAKRVRTETGIGSMSVSMASAAVDLAQKIFGKLAGRVVLVIGAGPMSELCARHLAADGAQVLVANRTFERAEALVKTLGGKAEARRFEALPQLLAEADVVVTSTAASKPIITPELVQPALKARKGRPLFLVDLAVPRDVDPAVHQLANVFAYNVDDLDRAVAESLAARGNEAARAEVLIAEEVARFIRAKTARDAVPVLGQLRRRADAIALSEAERTLAILGESLSAKQRQSIEAMAKAIVNKLLHAPTARLRTAGEAGPEEAARLAAAAAELFGLADALDETAAEPEAAPPIPIGRAEGAK